MTSPDLGSDFEHDLRAKLQRTAGRVEPPATTPSDIRALAATDTAAPAPTPLPTPVSSPTYEPAGRPQRWWLWAAAAAVVATMGVTLSRLDGPGTADSASDGSVSDESTASTSAASTSPPRSTVIVTGSTTPPVTNAEPGATTTTETVTSAAPTTQTTTTTSGPIDVVALSIDQPTPDGSIPADGPLTVTGTASSTEAPLAVVRIVVQDLGSRRYLQADGQFDKSWHYVDADFTSADRAGWRVETPPLPAGSYTVRVRAIDSDGNRTDWMFVPFTAQ